MDFPQTWWGRGTHNLRGAGRCQELSEHHCNRASDSNSEGWDALLYGERDVNNVKSVPAHNNEDAMAMNKHPPLDSTSSRISRP